MSGEAGTTAQRRAYAAAGVDVEAGERAVDLLRERIARAGAGGVDLLGGLGGFAAAVPLPGGFREPVLVSATDGVGTKTEIARRMGRRETIGRDLVAMCADDVVCHGARPFLFLDYVAVGQLDPSAVAEVVGGIADACAEAGCTLAGGETAEHPGLMEPDAFDLAGFCLGLVERADLLDGSTARPGDVVLGIESSGLHANGYSLVRRLVAEAGLDLDEPFGWSVRRLLRRGPADAPVDASFEGESLGEVLLRATRLYAPHVLAVRDALAAAGLRLSGMSHVTGGGLPGNLPRSVGPDLGVVVDPRTWPQPDVVALLADLGGLSGPEARATFNGGIGMALVLEPPAIELAVATLAGRGLRAWPIGRIVPAREAGPSRYAEVVA